MELQNTEDKDFKIPNMISEIKAYMASRHNSGLPGSVVSGIHLPMQGMGFDPQ